MVNIQAAGRNITCNRGANLRQVLLKNGIDVYNGNAKVINCRGIGTCRTCAVVIEGEVSEPKWREKARLSVPPHAPNSQKRLSCQLKVLGDIKVTKYNGFWGQGSEIVWSPEGKKTS